MHELTEKRYQIRVIRLIRVWKKFSRFKNFRELHLRFPGLDSGAQTSTKAATKTRIMKSRPTCKAELFAGRTTGISTYRRIAVGYRNSNANTGQNKMKTISKLIYVAVSVVSLAIGAVTVNGALNDLLVSINGTGANGEGLIYEYTPTGVQSLFASGLSEPRGMVFDRFGNLFVANTTFDEPSQTVQASIVKIARPDKAKQWLPPNDAGRERGKFF